MAETGAHSTTTTTRHRQTARSRSAQDSGTQMQLAAAKDFMHTPSRATTCSRRKTLRKRLRSGSFARLGSVRVRASRHRSVRRSCVGGTTGQDAPEPEVAATDVEEDAAEGEVLHESLKDTEEEGCRRPWGMA